MVVVHVGENRFFQSNTRDIVLRTWNCIQKNLVLPARGYVTNMDRHTVYFQCPIDLWYWYVKLQTYYFQSPTRAWHWYEHGAAYRVFSKFHCGVVVVHGAAKRLFS